MGRFLRSFVWLTAAVGCMSLGACKADPVWQADSGVVWGTGYNIKYLGERNLADSITAVFNGINMSLSVFEPNSNISRINAGLTDTLQPMASTVFVEAMRVNRVSGGAFDPTVGPLVNLWGFGPDSTSTVDATPSQQTIDSVLQYVGIGRCSVGADGLLHGRVPGMQFNFSALAKGYGVDCVGDMLKRNGVFDFMVEIGGEVLVSGNGPQGDGWHVQIDDPSSGATGHVRNRVITVSDCAVATSGNYRNNRQLADGRRVSHIVSPQTGYPVQSDLLSVTVVAPRCITADALATAAMAMPADDALRMLRAEPGVSALIIVSDAAPITIGPAFP